MFEEQPPPILYKYRTINEQSIRMITHSELWFSNAKTFNDPFDTAFTYNLDGLYTELAEYWSRVAAERHLSHLSLMEKETYRINRLKEMRNNPSHIEEMRQKAIEDGYRKWGICSFSGLRDNLLLWAHYTDKHQGFCVGLLWEKLNEICNMVAKDNYALYPTKVKYSGEIPNLNLFESMINMRDDAPEIDEFIKTKSDHWAYEDEWRLVFWEWVGRPYQVGHDAISEVILGCRISDENKERLISLCRKHVPHAKIFQAQKDERQFKLNLVEIC